MRIIAGDFRGRALTPVGKGDSAAHLRPTTDRIRETLFNVLAGGYDDVVQDALVLDLFAGTGALGLEALSRGAKSAVFVDNGRTALSLLKRNIALLGVEDRADIQRRDLRRPGPCSGSPADLVFMDPPYGKGLGEITLAAMDKGGWIAEDPLIVWEEQNTPDMPEGFRLVETRRMGATHISFVKRA